MRNSAALLYAIRLVVLAALGSATLFAQTPRAGDLGVKAPVVNSLIPGDAARIKPQPSDRPVWLGYAATIGLTVADIETAQACVRAHTCREGNPLVANRGIGYGIGFGLDTLGFFSARAAHRQHRKYWFAPVMAASAWHSVGTAVNLRAAHQH